MTAVEKQSWVPLESNPDVLNKYVHNLGVPEEWEFVDIFGLDEELLLLVPRPVIAVMMLYPITKQSEAGEKQLGEVKDSVKNMYFMKQTVGNACGTVAVIHALANNTNNIKFEDNKHFTKFLAETMGKEPSEKASMLESDQAMGAAHGESAQEGQTEAPPREEHVNTHFIAFVCLDGGLYELDGRKAGPVHHGPTSEDSLLEDSAEVVKKFMARDPTQLNFTLMALAKNS